jgi:hypothetical protein
LPFNDMTEAKLVVTDELITAALRRSKFPAGGGGEENSAEGSDGGGDSGARRGLRPRTKNKNASSARPEASQP